MNSHVCLNYSTAAYSRFASLSTASGSNASGSSDCLPSVTTPRPEVDASVHNGGSAFRCVSPPHWNQGLAAQKVSLELTLNGQDYLGIAAPHLATFTYTNHM